MNWYQYKLWYSIVVLSFILICMIIFCGCAPIESGPGRGGGTTANPGAFARIDMARGVAELSSNRDDDGTVEGFEVKVPSGISSPVAGATVSIKKMDLKANASRVRQANADQIESMGDFNEATGRAWSNVVDSVGTAVSRAADTILGRAVPQTGAWAMKLLVLGIGVPVAACFAGLILFVGILTFVILGIIGTSVVKRVWARSRATP